MKKDSYDFEAKRAYRQAYRDFIQPLVRAIGPKGVRVACFPGHEGLEVTEVYDALGIPRGNIFGLERSEQIADEIVKRVPGINIIQSHADRHFQQTGQTYDIINLDFQGHFGEPEEAAIAAICGRRVLVNHGVLATNFYAAREQRNRQGDYLWSANMARIAREGLNKVAQKAYGHSVGYKLPEIKDNLKDARDDAISQKLLMLIAGSGAGFFGEEIARLMPKSLRELLVQVNPSIDFSDNKQIKSAMHNYTIQIGIRSVYLDALTKLPEFRSTDRKNLMNLLDFLVITKEKPYLVEEHKRYSYRTGKQNMLVDFLRLNTDWHKWENNALSFEFPDENHIKAKVSLSSDLRDLDKKVRKFIAGPARMFIPEYLPGRAHLGEDRTDESVQESALEETAEGAGKSEELRGTKLTDEQNKEIYFYITHDIPDEEIMAAFGISKRELGARKAWVTMRKK